MKPFFIGKVARKVPPKTRSSKGTFVASLKDMMYNQNYRAPCLAYPFTYPKSVSRFFFFEDSEEKN